jgi:hypothetical protein
MPIRLVVKDRRKDPCPIVVEEREKTLSVHGNFGFYVPAHGGSDDA